MTISSFKGNLVNPVRPNQFRVTLNFPAYVAGGSDAARKGEFLVKAAELPGSSIPPVPTAYRGRLVNYAGDRVFNPWTISIYNDFDFALRNAFESWMNGIDANTTGKGNTTPAFTQVDMLVEQLDRNDQVLKTYKLINAYPIDVAGVGLDFGANDQISESVVTIAYDFWESDTTPALAGQAISAISPLLNT